MLIREIKMSDAKNLANLIKQVENESQYMLFESGERNIGAEQLEKRITSMKKEGHSTIFVAENDGELIGYLFIIGETMKRKRHSAYLVIGILRQYRGIGVGTNLFIHLEKWAVKNQIHRLELTVVTRNEAGLALYKKMGFEIEGTKRHSLYIQGEFVDEYYMSKLL